MPTKLSRYAEGLIEAAWLAAVIVVPIFFNVFSSRIFEPDKITILRTLALVILAAWIVKLVEGGRPRWERLEPGENWWKTLTGIPLLLPVIALAIVYLISTIFSVTPATSFWGSYQRLQGTYTTFSYLVVFAAILGNLRRRAQVERLISAVIVASLPVSLYGILQRYRIDPIPWGGDVTNRIAANMGNSIFVAAYLIMVFPLTLVRIVQSFSAILNERGRMAANFSRATGYVFIAALELIAIYFSGSRGPWLGLMAGSFFLLLVLTLLWRKRWLTFTITGLALAGMIFLVVLNIPNGPLEALRTRPELNRLGQVFDAESRTGRVRELIWQGAAQLVLPHDPLEFPDGHKDTFNFLRPLIGYGPESMYVAYNPFYPPALTQVEKRNASPDRSHNETWDSLVITGVLGLAVYLTLFLSVFYYGLKWLGLINSPRQRRLFLALTLGGGAVSAAGFIAAKGTAYLGVGLPFGIIIGLFAYVIIASLFGRYKSPETEGEMLRALTLAGLLVVIIGHFVEINFGIAIVVTRTYFFVFSALLVAAGYILPKYDEYGRSGTLENTGPSEVSAEPARAAGARPGRKASQAPQRKKRRTARDGAGGWGGAWPAWLQEAVIGGVLVGIILMTLGFDLISNAQGSHSAFGIIGSSLIRVKTPSGGASSGILAMLFTTWLVGGVILMAETFQWQEARVWLKALGIQMGIALLIGVFFWVWHAGGLASLASSQATNLEGVLQQVARYEGVVTRYYFYLFVLMVALAPFLPCEWPFRAAATTWAGATAAGIGAIVVIALTSYTNLRIIQADIAFKLAEPFTRSNSWPVAIAIYDRANSLAPSEDYYYLFLGRAYLEEAKTLNDVTQRDGLIAQAGRDLQKAQAINPLNTDHTANLARLYSLWASFTNDEQARNQRAATSSQYFSKALTLSPNSAKLWDEWGLLYLNILKNQEEASQRLMKAREIDPYYDWTYALLGDYYMRTADQAANNNQAAEREQALQQAEQNYQKAIDLVDPADTQSKYNYYLALGNSWVQAGQAGSALQAYQQALEIAPAGAEVWRVEETLARLYSQQGDAANALLHAQQALSTAPEDQKTRLQGVVAQLQGQK